MFTVWPSLPLLYALPSGQPVVPRRAGGAVRLAVRVALAACGAGDTAGRLPRPAGACQADPVGAAAGGPGAAAGAPDRPAGAAGGDGRGAARSEEHTAELQSLMRNAYADFCMEQKT